MNRTPKRLGYGASANAGSDSSHGSAMVTPAPRSTVRREMRRDISATSCLGCRLQAGGLRYFVQELRAGNNGINQGGEAVVARREAALHTVDQRIVGELQRAAEAIDEQLARNVVDEVLLAALANVCLDAFRTRARKASGEDRTDIDRPPGKVLRAALAHWAVAFVGDADRIEASVA